jgi:hypothetical protein
MDRTAIGRHLSNQVRKTVAVRRGRRDGETFTALVEDTYVQPFSAEIES